MIDWLRLLLDRRKRELPVRQDRRCKQHCYSLKQAESMVASSLDELTRTVVQIKQDWREK